LASAERPTKRPAISGLDVRSKGRAPTPHRLKSGWVPTTREARAALAPRRMERAGGTAAIGASPPVDVSWKSGFTRAVAREDNRAAEDQLPPLRLLPGIVTRMGRNRRFGSGEGNDNGAVQL
jgi:hypothetical protein